MGTKARVVTERHSYAGWIRTWEFEGSGVLLYDATRDDGETFSDVIVDDPVAVERLDGDKSIEVVDLDAVSPSPYSLRANESPDWEYVRKFRERGHLVSYPTVRPASDEGYETVSGHRRIESAREAELGEIPVLVEEIDDWEATKRFVFAHVPLPSERGEDESGLYSPDEVEDLFELLLEDWSLEELSTLPPLEPETAHYEQ